MKDIDEMPSSEVRLAAEAFITEFPMPDVEAYAEHVVETDEAAWGGFYDEQFNWSDDEGQECIPQELADMPEEVVIDAVRNAIEEWLSEEVSDDDV